MILNTNDNVFQTPSKKRRKEGKSSRKSKKQRTTKEIDAENVDSINVPLTEPTQELQSVIPPSPESPIFIPTLSSPEPDTPDSYADTPIQSHAKVDLVTFNSLTSNSGALLQQSHLVFVTGAWVDG